MSTVTKSPTANFLQEKVKAEELLKAYTELQTEKAAIDESMKKAKSELEAFARKHRSKFSDGTLKLGTGYLRFGSRTEVQTTRGFNLVAFCKSFPDLIKREFKTAACKALTRHKLRSAGLKLVESEVFDIVTKVAS